MARRDRPFRSAVLIGCNGSRDHGDHLQYAESDILNRLYPWLHADSGWSDDKQFVICGIDSQSLPNGQRPILSTREIITSITDATKKAHRGDIVFIYFSGHAIWDDGVHLVLPLLHDTLPLDHLYEETLQKNTSQAAIMLVVDACQPEEFDGIGEKIRGAFSKILDPIAQSPKNTRQYHGTRLFFASCSQGQSSFENPVEGGGVFTSAFIRGCENPRIIRDTSLLNGEITIEHVEQFVQEDLRCIQHPILKGSSVRIKRVFHNNNGSDDQHIDPLLLEDAGPHLDRAGLPTALEIEYSTDKLVEQPRYPEKLIHSASASFSFIPHQQEMTVCRSEFLLGYDDILAGYTISSSNDERVERRKKRSHYRFKSSQTFLPVPEGVYRIASRRTRDDEHPIIYSCGFTHSQLRNITVPRLSHLDPYLSEMSSSQSDIGIILSLKITKSGKYAFTLNDRDEFVLWNVKDLSHPPVDLLPSKRVTHFALNEDRYCCSTIDREIYWGNIPESDDAIPPDFPHLLNSLSSSVTSIAINPKHFIRNEFSTTLSAAYNQGDIIMWDIIKNTGRYKLGDLTPPARLMAFSEDSRWFVASGGSRIIIGEQLKDGTYKEVDSLDINTIVSDEEASGTMLEVSALTFSSSILMTPMLIIGTNKGGVFLWELERNRLMPLWQTEKPSEIFFLAMHAWDRYAAQLIIASPIAAMTLTLVARRYQQ